MSPRLIVVSGSPGSGKTTLARCLGQRLHCPMLSRDEVREGILFGRVDAADDTNDSVAMRANAAFFDATEGLLCQGVSLVIEAAFQHRLWAGPLERLMLLADVRIVRCKIDPEVALQRIADRLSRSTWRQGLHPDAAYLEAHSGQAPDRPAFDAIHMDHPTLDVDTTNAYLPGVADIVAFASRA